MRSQWHDKQLGTYPVCIGLSCTYCVHELIKLTKKSEKFIYVISILLHLYIKFQCQILNNKRAIKKTKILTNL
jgi:hypothetical protein